MRMRQAFIVAILAGIATMSPAHADSVYAYWSYWQGDAGTWKYATVGPATSPAIDGAVDGWRFTLGSDGKAAQPTPDADFSTICGATPKTAGKVRVAVVIDYGSAAASTPVSVCAVVTSGLSRASALSAVAALRLNNGFICAINDIPESGCGDAVAPTSPSPSTEATASARPSKPAARATTSASPSPAPSSSKTPAPVSTDAAAATPDATNATSASPGPSATDKTKADSSSPVSTIVTALLGAGVLLMAYRNARRQRESR